MDAERASRQQSIADLTADQSEPECDASKRLSVRSSEIPATVGGYEVLNRLGEGSFGTVWLARERKTGRLAAIKFFNSRRGLDWTLLTREVEKLAVLDASRDVVRLLDVSVDHDPPYFVMEYLPNRSVAALMEAGPIPIQQAIEITRSVARALVHAHGAGILHCDVKPGNVLLDRGDEARLGDFGQSRLATDHGSSLGTFYYMAPEQALRNAVPDVRWDVYALGALLYYMTTGSPPYKTQQSEETLQAAGSLDDRLEAYRHLIATSPFPSEHRIVPGMDSALVTLIDRCLHRDPTKRLPNAQAVLDALEYREMNRAKRPLIWLGFLGPLVFLATLIWIGSRLLPAARTQAEVHLLERALASDTATARLLAANIEQELLDRIANLERLANRLPPLEGETKNYFGFREDVISILDTWREANDEQLKKQNRTLDESVFLTDANGIQLYRSPWSDSIGMSFAYRDYFHALGRELSAVRDNVSDIKPRTSSGVSIAFRSSNTGEYMVALASPVMSRDKTKVIGVLARTIHLSDLLEQWEERIDRPGAGGMAGKERLLSVVDMRETPPLILDHEWMSGRSAEDLNSVSAKRLLSLSPAEEQLLRKAVRNGLGIDRYQDPLADQDARFREDWIAAVAATQMVDWIAIVQERRADVVAPMMEMNGIFLRYGLLMLVIFGVMLVLLWWLIQRAAEL